MEVRDRLPAAVRRLSHLPVSAVRVECIADAQLGVERGAVGGSVVQTGLLVGGKTVTETVDLISAQWRTSTLQLPLHGLLQLENKQNSITNGFIPQLCLSVFEQQINPVKDFIK